MISNNLKSILIPIFLLGIIFSTTAQEVELNADSIPSFLKKNADAVIRKYEKTLEVHSESSATEYVSETVTILNSDGDFHSYFIAYYNEFSSISKIKIEIFDAKGNKIKKDNEIKDISASNSSTIYSDSRVKLYRPNIVNYPYTVRYKYKRKINSMLSWPKWIPINHSNVSIQSDTYKIITPKTLKYLVKEKNLIQPAKITEQEDKTIRTYSLSNFKAFKHESYGSEIDDFAPTVIISPENFNYSGYSGSYSSWQAFGKFIYELNSDRDNLSLELKTKIDKLTSGISSDSDKAKVIYEFMQNNTRYVSIQYGIGGHQPMYASEVEENGYGDCKALSNYTYAMLNYVGVNAQYALIKAGDDGGEFDEDIAYSPFNHAILCLPNKGDTLWLECTSQKNPFGFLGDFTGNRKALVITPEGGKLANTTKYGDKENVKNRKLIVDISGNGNAKATLTQQNKGIFYSELSFLSDKTLKEQKKYFYDILSMKNLHIEKIKIDVTKNILPKVDMDMELELSSYAKISTSRIFIPLNMFYNGYRLKKNKNRKGKIRNKFAFVINDSITYNIPKGYKIESIPKAVNIKNEFGEFSTSVKFINNQVLFNRKYQLKEGEFSADKFDDFFRFNYKKQKADRKKIVLVKNI